MAMTVGVHHSAQSIHFEAQQALQAVPANQLVYHIRQQPFQPHRTAVLATPFLSHLSSIAEIWWRLWPPPPSGEDASFTCTMLGSPSAPDSSNAVPQTAAGASACDKQHTKTIPLRTAQLMGKWQTLSGITTGRGVSCPAVAVVSIKHFTLLVAESSPCRWPNPYHHQQPFAAQLQVSGPLTSGNHYIVCV
jgi:hypothetical protein